MREKTNSEICFQVLRVTTQSTWFQSEAVDMDLNYVLVLELVIKSEGKSS
jgi:hypothetical protein